MEMLREKIVELKEKIQKLCPKIEQEKTAVYFVTNRKPLSHNKAGKSDAYKRALQNEFNTKYSRLYENIPFVDEKLKTAIVYIHSLRPGVIPDVDNLSKPIVDAFTGVIYKDDSLVVKRSATILPLSDFDFIVVDATDIPPKVLKDFDTYCENMEENIVLFSVDKISLSEIKIGEF